MSLHVVILADIIEVFVLNLFEELFSSCISNEKSFGGSSSLQSDFSSKFEVADQKVSLNYSFNTLVPVCVSRYCLSHHHKLRFLCLRYFFLFFFFFSIIVSGVSVFGSELIKEICSTFCSHRLELLLLSLLIFLGSRCLLLLRLQELAAKDSFYFLHDLGLIIAERFQKIVKLAQMKTFHNNILLLVNFILGLSDLLVENLT